MYIRKEKEADREYIAEIQYAAFKDHPIHEPGAEPVEHLIVERLRNAGALALSLVAELQGKLLGHIAFSAASVGNAAEGWLLLGPVAVLPDLQQQGIGSVLIRNALDCLKKQGAAGVVLVGSPEYYGRFGFRSYESLCWEGVPSEFVLALPFTDEVPAGMIKGHEAFGE